MPKTAGSLTGGTGDYNPQWYRLSVSFPGYSVASGYTGASSAVAVQSFPLPVPKFSQKQGKSIVVEILRCRWGIGLNVPFTSLSTGYALSIETVGQLLSKNPGSSLPASTDGSVVDYYSQNGSYTVSPGTSTTDLLGTDLPNQQPVLHDLTDGAGHGVLIATDNIYLGAQGNISNYNIHAGATTGPTTVECDLLYRFKEVTIQEYVGIVQSQQ